MQWVQSLRHDFAKKLPWYVGLSLIYQDRFMLYHTNLDAQIGDEDRLRCVWEGGGVIL